MVCEPGVTVPVPKPLTPCLTAAVGSAAEGAASEEHAFWGSAAAGAAGKETS